MADYESMKASELRLKCKELGLDFQKGNKSDLVDRLVQEASSSKPKPIGSAKGKEKKKKATKKGKEEEEEEEEEEERVVVTQARSTKKAKVVAPVVVANDVADVPELPSPIYGKICTMAVSLGHPCPQNLLLLTTRICGELSRTASFWRAVCDTFQETVTNAFGDGEVMKTFHFCVCFLKKI